ncbi:hypothetical protein CSPX01_13443 [Colletotrichum filicis]|nr:hypothetical protein CSPX01_13443 [Colletotrichum filicis]
MYHSVHAAVDKTRQDWAGLGLVGRRLHGTESQSVQRRTRQIQCSPCSPMEWYVSDLLSSRAARLTARDITRQDPGSRTIDQVSLLESTLLRTLNGTTLVAGGVGGSILLVLVSCFACFSLCFGSGAWKNKSGVCSD